MDKSPRPGGSESILTMVMSRGVIKFSLVVALVGGTIVSLINQGETLASGDELSLGKVLLTYITLYCTATYLVITTH